MREIITAYYDPLKDLWIIRDGRTGQKLGACYAGPGELINVYGGNSTSEALRAYLDDVEGLSE